MYAKMLWNSIVFIEAMYFIRPKKKVGLLFWLENWDGR